MILRRFKLVILLISCLVIFCGCGKISDTSIDSNNVGSTTTKVTIVDEDFNESGTGTLSCTTEAYAGDGIDVSLGYTVVYRRGYILELRSIAKITSSDQKSLDEYENAYQNIADNYEGLKYYDVSLIRDSNTVTYDTTINYEKIDIDKLLEIEGEEDNIIDNDKAKLSLWLDLAEKVGTTCKEV